MGKVRNTDSDRRGCESTCLTIVLPHKLANRGCELVGIRIVKAALRMRRIVFEA